MAPKKPEKKTVNRKKDISTASRTNKHKTHKHEITMAEYCRVFQVAVGSFKSRDGSDTSKDYQNWRKFVKKHGPSKPYTTKGRKRSVKADVIQLMLASSDGDVSDADKLVLQVQLQQWLQLGKTKPHAGVSKKLYVKYSDRHDKNLRAAAVSDGVALSADVINAIKTKTEKDVAPYFLDDNILYFWEGGVHSFEHILRKEGQVLDSTVNLTASNLYAKSSAFGKRPKSGIIEPFQQVQFKKLRKNGSRVSIEEIYDLIKAGVCTGHLLQRHCGLTAKLAAQLAETTAIQQGKKLLAAGMMNVREILRAEGKASTAGAVAMGVTCFDQKKLLDAGYTWQV